MNFIRCSLAVTIAAAAFGFAKGADKNPVIVIETSLGTIKVELMPDKAPITVKNFLAYVDDKFYDGTIFHRIIKNFMIQGGGFESGMKEKATKQPIINESTNGLPNARGTIAMARTPVPNSATAQFYLNLKNNDFLNKDRAADGVGYCVFGKVIDGMDVVDRIADVKTAAGDVPQQEVVIKSVRKE